MTKAPKIDGILDKPLWETHAYKITNFKQYVPKNKEDVTHKTDVYIGHDKKNLYIAFRAFDSEADRIRYCVNQRDNCKEDDFISVFWIPSMRKAAPTVLPSILSAYKWI
jgi:hypothetical protein